MINMNIYIYIDKITRRYINKDLLILTTMIFMSHVALETI